MPTVMAFAKLADAVYGDRPEVDGWTLVDMKGTGSGLTDAFQGAAFRRGGELVFAFKGTSNARDAVADIKLGVGMNTHQYASASEFVSRVPTGGCRAFACGHSLGGATAQIIGNRHRLPFVTFNAPGVGLISRNVDEMAATVALGTALTRTIGTMASAVLHPVQAAQDVGAMFHTVNGVNFRLGKDVVGCIGVHYGRVIEIAYSGGSLDVVAKHKMATVLAALATSSWRNQEVV